MQQCVAISYKFGKHHQQSGALPPVCSAFSFQSWCYTKPVDLSTHLSIHVSISLLTHLPRLSIHVSTVAEMTKCYSSNDGPNETFACWEKKSGRGVQRVVRRIVTTVMTALFPNPNLITISEKRLYFRHFLSKKLLVPKSKAIERNSWRDGRKCVL